MRCQTRVLVATASDNLTQLVSRELSRHGYVPHQVADGSAALGTLGAFPHVAVVTDAHLEGCRGPSLVHDLRDRGITTPAVLLLDSDTGYLREAARRLGSTFCLVGPDLSRLSDALASARDVQVV